MKQNVESFQTHWNSRFSAEKNIKYQNKKISSVKHLRDVMGVRKSHLSPSAGCRGLGGRSHGGGQGEQGHRAEVRTCLSLLCVMTRVKKVASRRTGAMADYKDQRDEKTE